MKKSDLEPGKTYKIEISDCCVHADVNAGKFIRFGNEDDENDPFNFYFENISIVYENGQWSVEEVSESIA